MATNVRFFKIKHFDNYETDFKNKSISDIVGNNNFYEEAFYLNSNDGSLYLGNQKLSNAQEVQQLIENFEQLYDFQREITTTNTDGTVTTETIDYSDIDKGKAIRTIAIEELSYQLLSDKAEADFKTLQELGAWIEDHPESVAEMNFAIQNNANEIDDIQLDIIRLDVQSDWELDNDQSHAYIKNKPPIKKGQGENSIQQEGSIAISNDSTAMGSQNVAGCKGYYINALDFSNKKIYLSETQVINAPPSNIGEQDTTFETPLYDIGNKFTIITPTKHYLLCGTIESIENNVITYSESDDLGFTEFLSLEELQTEYETTDWSEICAYDDYSVSVPNQPTVGIVTITSCSSAEGGYNIAAGSFSHAEGAENLAVGNFSHVEGQKTIAFYSAHAEGYGTSALASEAHAEGEGSSATRHAAHAEGYYTKADGLYSHTEGNNTQTIGNYSHAEGHNTIALGHRSHAEGGDTQAWGDYSHAEGIKTISEGKYSHAEGRDTQACGDYSHAEGQETVTYGDASHAEGYSSCAHGRASHAEGRDTQACGSCSHAEGRDTQACGYYSHAEGYSSCAYGDASHAEGFSTNECPTYLLESSKESIVEAWNANKFLLAYGESAHAEGRDTLAVGNQSHTEGYLTLARGIRGHAEGYCTEANGVHSHAEGQRTKAYGELSHAEGYQTIARGQYQHVQGKNNIEDTENLYAHIVGGGKYSSTPSNLHTIRWDNGQGFFKGGTTTEGADYAEYFEWADGNLENEDRVGLLVTLDGEKIKLANADDEVLGIISGTAAVLGDNYECEWNGKYLTDDFGRIIYDMVEEFIDVEHIEFKEVEKEVVDEETQETRIEIELEEIKTVEKKSAGFWKHPRLNPDYNPEQVYVNRSDRPEWDTVGMLGKLFVRDDGTCEVNGYATVGENGIATKSEEKTNMRVLSRVNENIIRVLLK